MWFTAGAKSSASFTFKAEKTAANSVLIMAAEDYSGNTSLFGPGPRPGPEYLNYYTTALADAGISYDVYDVDAHARTAPDPLGVLSHYKSIIWYTADDLYVREPTQPGGTGNSKLMDDEVIAVRDYLNDGGAALVTGQQALVGAWLQLALQPAQGQTPAPVVQEQQLDGPEQRGQPGRADDELHHRLQRLRPVLPRRVDQRDRG